MVDTDPYKTRLWRALNASFKVLRVRAGVLMRGNVTKLERKGVGNYLA